MYKKTWIEFELHRMRPLCFIWRDNEASQRVIDKDIGLCSIERSFIWLGNVQVSRSELH